MKEYSDASISIKHSKEKLILKKVNVFNALATYFCLKVYDLAFNAVSCSSVQKKHNDW